MQVCACGPGREGRVSGIQRGKGHAGWMINRRKMRDGDKKKTRVFS
jgi:hypothetical protein